MKKITFTLLLLFCVGCLKAQVISSTTLTRIEELNKQAKKKLAEGLSVNEVNQLTEEDYKELLWEFVHDNYDIIKIIEIDNVGSIGTAKLQGYDTTLGSSEVSLMYKIWDKAAVSDPDLAKTSETPLFVIMADTEIDGEWTVGLPKSREIVTTFNAVFNSLYSYVTKQPAATRPMLLVAGVGIAENWSMFCASSGGVNLEDLQIIVDEYEIIEEVIEITEEVPQIIIGTEGTSVPVVAGPPITADPVVEETDDNRIIGVPEVMASFPSGDEALYKWLKSNIRYPEEAKEKGIQGRVMVKLVIEKDGSIGKTEVTRSPNELLSKEAVRVVKAMPKWRPARQGARAVRSYFNLPVMFRLDEEK